MLTVANFLICIILHILQIWIHNISHEYIVYYISTLVTIQGLKDKI